MNKKMCDKKKLLFVNGHLGIGGVEKSLTDVLKSIDYEKYEVDLLLFEGYGEYFSQIPSAVNVILFDLNKTFGSFKSVLLSAIKNGDFQTFLLKILLTMRVHLSVKYVTFFKLFKITEKEYDCAIAYRFGICADYVGFAAKAKKKFVWWHHGSFEFPEKTIREWQTTAKKMNQIVCVSESTKRLLLPYFSEKEIKVIPNMILSEEIKEKSNAYYPYMDNNKTILVSVGRLSEEKHMINAVYAMESLVKKGYKSLCWYLVGDGAERKKIEDAIEQRDLKEYVICVGSQKNPYPYIAQADFFVHPSYVEAHPITVLEAFVLGKRSVVTRSVGTQNLIIDKKNALFAEPSVDDLTEKVENLIFDNFLDKNYLKYQKETLEPFSPQEIILKIMDLV